MKQLNTAPGLVSRRVHALRLLARSRIFLIASASAALVYLLAFQYLDKVSGMPAMAGQSYFALYYSLIGVSSVFMGANIYDISHKLSARKASLGSGVGSSSASVVGGIISCSCHASLLLPVISLIGLGAMAAGSVVFVLVKYQILILGSFIATNLLLFYYRLGKLAP